MMESLDHIKINGFKSIKNMEPLALRPINILIGANGSGKSNLILAFTLLTEIRTGRRQEYVARKGGAETLLHFGSRRTNRIEIEARLDGGQFAYRLTLVPTDRDSLALAPGELTVADQGVYTESMAGYPDGWGIVRPDGQKASVRKPPGGPTWGHDIDPLINQLLDGHQVFPPLDTSDHSALKENCRVHDNRQLRSDCSNLAAFLHLLRENHPNAYSAIVHTVQMVAPFIDDFDLETLELNRDTIRLEWKHKGSDHYFDAASLSDGTLRFIALATIFLQPIADRPRLIILDDPDIGLHPYAIYLLGALIRQASIESKILVATQSPRLIDQFEPEDILVAERTEGSTTYTRQDRDTLESWLEDYTLGDVWEKNVMGGRPRPE